MADVSSIVLPIVTGLGGILVGAGFRARTFSRWTLLRRFRLQVAAERKAGRAP